jgi:hypothetical protein
LSSGRTKPDGFNLHDVSVAAHSAAGEISLVLM